MTRVLLSLIACFIAGVPVQAAGKSLTVPIEVEQGLVLAKVRVWKSGPLTMIVDTGAASTVLSSARLAETGLAGGEGARASVQGGEVEAETVKNISVLIGGRILPIEELAVLDLSGLTASIGRRIDGILGYELFATYSVELDYRRHRMTLRSSGSVAEGTAILIEVRDNTPFVAAILRQAGDRIPARLLLDTGGVSALTLYAEYIGKHPELVSAGAREITAGAVLPGQFRARVGRIDAIEVGPFRFRQPVVNFSGSGGADDAAPGDSGQIGAAILSRNKVTIDLVAGRLYLLPQSGADPSYDFDASGISIAAAPNDPSVRRIRQVLPNSPAAEADLRVGDLLITIDGRDARRVPLGRLRGSLRVRDRTHALVIERNGARISVRLSTRKIV